MTPRLDPIDWFFSLSLFKQLFAILLLGPITASVWALIEDMKRPSPFATIERTHRSEDAGDHREHKAA